MPPKKDGKGKGGGNPLGGGAEPQPPGQQAEEELPPEGPNPFAPAAAEPAEEAEEFAEGVEEEVTMQQLLLLPHSLFPCLHGMLRCRSRE